MNRVRLKSRLVWALHRVASFVQVTIFMDFNKQRCAFVEVGDRAFLMSRMSVSAVGIFQTIRDAGRAKACELLRANWSELSGAERAELTTNLRQGLLEMVGDGAAGTVSK